jgi:gluconokinase
MPERIVIMGVAGCGKTSVGEALGHAIGAPFIDGDALHPQSNIDKMAAGSPLKDEDRWPWLDEVGDALANAKTTLIIGCSALRRAYRDRIRDKAGPVIFIHLSGSRELILQRMASREGHFMPVSLLDSQFATLEPPQADERFLTVDIDQPLEEITAGIVARL